MPKSFPRRPLWVFSGVVLVVLGLSQFGASGSSGQDDVTPTTVFLVRHAEKQALPGEDDPPLTEAGARRAEELARILGAAEIRAIYTSQYLRTKQTAEPLARQLGIAPTTLAIDPSSDSPDGISPESIQRIADQVYAHAGEPALIVGHSNTIPLVIRALGGDIVPTIEDSDFNDLFVVVVYAKGKARVTHLEFGAGR